MNQISFSLTQVISMASIMVTMFVVIVGFLVRRSVFGEIDGLKQEKQDKSFCTQRYEMCERDNREYERDILEIKEGLKEGNKEFKSINRKIDRIMGALKITIDETKE